MPCTSYRCTKSASAVSPLSAAKTTFALNAARRVGRDRLAMFALDMLPRRRFEARIPRIGLSEFGQSPLTLGRAGKIIITDTFQFHIATVFYFGYHMETG